MKNLFGFDGGFTNGCSRLFDLLVLGFLWILCSIPLVTIGASTTALYYSVVKSVKNKTGYAVTEFFRSFRRNLIPGSSLGLLMAAVLFVLQLNIGILQAKTGGYTGLFFICFYIAASVYVVLAGCYMFPALSRFDMSAGWILKLSLYMVVRYFGTTIGLLLVLFCAGAFLYRFPVLLFILPGPVMLLMSEFLERVLKKHEPEEVRDSAEADDAAEVNA